MANEQQRDEQAAAAAAEVGAAAVAVPWLQTSEAVTEVTVQVQANSQLPLALSKMQAQAQQLANGALQAQQLAQMQRLQQVRDPASAVHLTLPFPCHVTVL